MKAIPALLLPLALTGCFKPQTIVVKPLDQAIVEAATLAQKANAEKVEIELATTDAIGLDAEGTVKVVTLTGSISREASTTVTATIEDLKNWQPPTPAGKPALAPGLYEMNTKTLQLKQFTPQK